ncbi:MAG: hypothetical protein H0X27_03630 [Caulobacteraceae bacterium]|nr:hypothetical protein [Caulobacteraceae bacterium]
MIPSGAVGPASGDLAGTYPAPVIANGVVTTAKLAPIAANSVLSNWTSVTANVSANTWPSCSSAGKALKYQSGVGLGCANFLGSNTFTATQTINPQAETSGLIVSGGSITTTSAIPGISVAGTINTSGTVDGAGLLIAIADKAHGPASYLIDVYGGPMGATPEMSLGPTGNLNINGSLVLGRDTTTTAPPVKSVEGTSIASGTPDLIGGGLNLQGGQGTGGGAGGVVKLQTAPPGTSGGMTPNLEVTWLSGDASTHHAFGGSVPTISSCGTVSLESHSSDSAGQVNISGGPASCAITFAIAYTTWNHRLATAQSGLPVGYNYGLTALNITATTAAPALSGKIDYICEGI